MLGKSWRNEKIIETVGNKDLKFNINIKKNIIQFYEIVLIFPEKEEYVDLLWEQLIQFQSDQFLSCDQVVALDTFSVFGSP